MWLFLLWSATSPAVVSSDCCQNGSGYNSINSISDGALMLRPMHLYDENIQLKHRFNTTRITLYEIVWTTYLSVIHVYSFRSFGLFKQLYNILYLLLFVSGKHCGSVSNSALGTVILVPSGSRRCALMRNRQLSYAYPQTTIKLWNSVVISSVAIVARIQVASRQFGFQALIGAVKCWQWSRTTFRVCIRFRGTVAHWNANLGYWTDDVNSWSSWCASCCTFAVLPLMVNGDLWRWC